MFYVSIKKGVLDKVMDRAKSTDNEIIGILVGNVENHTIVIEDAISGEQESYNTRASLPPKTIAKVTDKILKGEVPGRIAGWYHSHPGFGIFMSSTDINTQKNLQQFSSKVTALIVDPDDGDFGFFTIHGSKDVIQLAKNQVHVYEEGEDKIPEHFSSPPEIPKPSARRDRKLVLYPHMPEPPGSGLKLITIGVAVALICAVIGAMIFVRNIPKENPEYSRVDSIILLGEIQINQEGTRIFRDNMTIRANLTIVEGKITEEGIRFYLGQKDKGWEFLGNETTPRNDAYILTFNTTGYDEGVHQIKVNFTDNSNDTWEKTSEQFIIDNIPDIPKPRFLDPREGDILDDKVIIYSEVKDEEDNIYSVGFYHRNMTGNWSKIQENRHLGEYVYVTDWDTNLLHNGTYYLKIKAEDRNLYMDEDVITVNILHDG